MAHADKRSVSTDALETLGTFPLNENEARDAIHLAVEPVVAGMLLTAGKHIGFDENGLAVTQEIASYKKIKNFKLLGIVDPFVKGEVQPGDRFWLVVYPRQIKSLRHVWEHPDFPESVATNVAVDYWPQEVAKATLERDPAPMEVPQIVSQRSVSEEWIEVYADSIGVDYEWLMDNANAYQVSTWHYVTHPEDSGRFEGEYLPDEFWTHWEIVTGKVAKNTGSFFTCSC